MPAPSLSLLRAFAPWTQQLLVRPSTTGCLVVAQQKSDFSTTPALAKKSKRQAGDPRIAAMTRFLHRPTRPRPLRFSRLRYLRHWTIHRAWLLHQSKLRTKRKTELYQQYQCMANACEVLRNIDSNGLTAEERSAYGVEEATGSDVGKLFRVAMQKSGVWDNVPIEYARLQTETPPKKGWNHEWTR